MRAFTTRKEIYCRRWRVHAREPEPLAVCRHSRFSLASFTFSHFSVFSVEINPKIVVVNKVKDNLFNRVDWVEKC